MTRDEAMREILRTTDFEFDGGKVVVRSVRLLAAIERDAPAYDAPVYAALAPRAVPQRAA